MSEVYWNALSEVQTQLQAQATASKFGVKGTDNVRSIDSDAIVLRKLSRDNKNSQRHSADKTPGMVITPGNRVVMDPEAGEVGRDDIVYPILIQIIDRDSGDNINGLRTYLFWQEQVARFFRNASLSNVTENYINYIAAVDNIDERQWVRHQNFINGIILHVMTREERGIQ